MEIKKAFLTGKHPYSFRVNKKAEILGVRLVSPTNKDFKSRLCFVLLYSDGFVDYVPISEYINGNYVLNEK